MPALSTFSLVDRGVKIATGSSPDVSEAGARNLAGSLLGYGSTSSGDKVGAASTHHAGGVATDSARKRTWTDKAIATFADAFVGKKGEKKA
jgi:hypothetical protein